MSLDPNSARSRSTSPAPNYPHDRRGSTPGLHPHSAAASRSPSPSVSPAMLPQGLGIRDVDVQWSPIGDHDGHHSSHHGNDRWRLTGRKGYNALPNTPPSREASPSRKHGRSRSVDTSSGHHSHHHHSHHHHHHDSHGSSGLTPPTPPERLAPPMPNTPPLVGGLHGRKGYNAHPDALPFSPVEVSDASPLRNRDHGLGSMGRKGYNSTPRSLSPHSNP